MKQFFVWLVLYYLRFFARLALFLWRPKVIGITGSVGKSSCRNAVFVVLKAKFGKKVKVIEKGNSETGIPLGILGLKIEDYSLLGWLKILVRVPFGIFYLKGTRFLVVEMGVDEPEPPKNMGYLLTIVKPEIAVFLNVHPVHSQQFGKVGKTREEILRAIAREKGRIIAESGCRVGIYNHENKWVNEIAKSEKLKVKKLYSFGTCERDFVRFKGWKVSLKGTSFEFEVCKKRTPRGCTNPYTPGVYSMRLEFKNFLLPKVYFETLSPAIIIGRILGMSFDKIKRALEKDFKLPPSRASIFEGINDSIIIDSTYNASYSSTSSLLDTAYQLAKKEKKELVFLFGDMRELGSLARQEHEKIAREAVEKVQYLYLVGELTKKYVLPIAKASKKLKEVKHFRNSFKAGEYLKNNLPKGCILLAKGSQNTIFLEEAIKPLLKDKKDAKFLCRQDCFWKRMKIKWVN